MITQIIVGLACVYLLFGLLIALMLLNRVANRSGESFWAGVILGAIVWPYTLAMAIRAANAAYRCGWCGGVFENEAAVKAHTLECAANPLVKRNAELSEQLINMRCARIVQGEADHD